MTVFSAVLLAGVLSVLALAAGVAAGTRLASRVGQHRQRVAAERSGITVLQMLERIVSLMPLGIVVVDTHRDVVYRNARAKELGLVRDRQLDDQAWQAAQQAVSGGEAVEFDLLPGKRTKPGQSGLAVHGQACLLSEEDPRFAVVFAHDQSEYARMEATRRDFVANVSHELKTPVGAMTVLAEALLASADDPETVRHFAERALIEANRLGDMVGELIELSRLQGAERLPNLSAVDVDTVVSEAISRHKVAADNADIEVRTDAPSGLRVLGDQTLLVTALANLVSNAVAYSARGSPVSISRRRRGDNIEIAVTDRGIGIASQDQERVFERFFRGDKARSRATGGSGLGLAIVKHVAANHKGSIRLWSQPGTGSTFTLSIPAYEDHGEDRKRGEAGRGGSSPDQLGEDRKRGEAGRGGSSPDQLGEDRKRGEAGRGGSSPDQLGEDRKRGEAGRGGSSPDQLGEDRKRGEAGRGGSSPDQLGEDRKRGEAGRGGSSPDQLGEDRKRGEAGRGGSSPDRPSVEPDQPPVRDVAQAVPTRGRNT